jgi:hypothetical protein
MCNKAKELFAAFDRPLPQAEELRSRILRQPMTVQSAMQVAALKFFALGELPEEDVALLKRLGADGMSTFMSYYILKAMSEDNMPAALNVLREYYGGMLDMGATTFWEDFHVEWLDNAARIDEVVPEGKVDLHGDFGDFCYKGFRHSFCHGWASGPVPFLTERVLGINIAAPGCKKIVLKPDLGDLEWAKGTFPTPAGILSVSLKRNADGTTAVEYDAPKGIEVELA